jgi:hypothetical protein
VAALERNDARILCLPLFQAAYNASVYAWPGAADLTNFGSETYKNRLFVSVAMLSNG